MSAVIGTGKTIAFSINQVDLLAGTKQYFVAPQDGQVVGFRTVVQVAITTGGILKLRSETNAVDMAGLSITVADAAPVATQQTCTATLGDSSRKVKKGDVVSIVVDAAFATAGAVNGIIEYESGDPTFDHVI